MLYPRGTREWRFVAVTADSMALLVIQMERSGVPEMARESESEPSALDHQKAALRSVIAVLVPPTEAEALWLHLVTGHSTLNYSKKKN